MLITPASLKFDVEINGFSFTNGSTQLAAWFKVARNGSSTLENPTETEDLFSRSGETGIRFGPTGAPRGSIAWADEVIADSSPVAVHHGPITQALGSTGTTEHSIYITLAQGGKLEWDPRVGVDGLLTPEAPPAPVPWEIIGGIAGGVVAGIVIGAVMARYATRRRVEVLKSNKQGDPNANRWKAPELNSTSDNVIDGKAPDHNSSRSNKSSSIAALDVDGDGGSGGSKVQDHNSSRSNKSSSIAAPDVDGDGSSGRSKVQDHNSSRSNKSSSTNAPDTGNGAGESEVRRHNSTRSNRTTNLAAPDEGGGGGSKAQDYNSSRSNKTASSAVPDEGGGGGSKAQDYNSSRSNKTASSAVPDEGGGGGSKAQDYNSSRSNKTASSAASDESGAGGSTAQEKERGITINTSHVEYETKAVARAPGDTDYRRPPRLAPDAAETVHQELHRPPTNRAYDKTSAKLEEPLKKVSKIDSFTVKRAAVSDDIGNARDYAKEPGKLVFPNIKVTLAESAAQSWIDWHESFVVKGNNDENAEKNGTLTLFSPNQQMVLARIRFFNMGIFSIGGDKSEANADQIKRVTAELYVEKMEFEVGDEGGEPASTGTTIPPAATKQAPRRG